MLRREIITLRLALLADQCGLRGALMHVVGDWSHVVEELRVNWPFAILIPHRFADDRCAGLGDRIAQRKPLVADDDIGKSLVSRAALVGRHGGRAEPDSSMPPRLRP